MTVIFFLLCTIVQSEHKLATEGIITEVARNPYLANPVCLEIAPDFGIYIGETYRQENWGVPDNRTYPDWLHEDLRLQTVEERGEMYKKYYPELVEAWTEKEDRIALLRDLDGDYLIDKSTPFAAGFSDLVAGTGAGLLYFDNSIYYTCIPDLWKMSDTDGDDRADQKESLQSGFGVRVAFRGHDMHGLTVGPFGRIYWSIGDRGYNIKTKEGLHFLRPETGAVFRCWPDGSNLEVFCTGLRNPQELAFDDYGNLFTVDNNCDAGDRARLLHLSRSSDSGWRMNLQYLPERGPWMAESWWDASKTDLPKFLNPALANISAGPSGLAYYPGVGMGPTYKGSFFLADFRGDPGNSGIIRFSVEPSGAGFAFKEMEEFWWNILATDICFAPDGSLYATDWVQGWIGEGQGKLFRADFAGGDIDLQEQTLYFLQTDIKLERDKTLLNLLNHPDRRVRQRAQFELRERESVPALHALAIDSFADRQARVHALWALAGKSLIDNQSYIPEACFKDADEEVRAQAIRSSAEFPNKKDLPFFIEALKDPSPRVQYFAALACGSLSEFSTLWESSESYLGLYQLAKSSTDHLVHSALSFALSRLASAAEILKLTPHHNEQQRLVSVIALRKQGSSALLEFVEDQSRNVASEAVLAIYDLGLEALKLELSSLPLSHTKYTSGAVRRILASKNLKGNQECLFDIYDYMSEMSNPEGLRREALEYLSEWEAPSEFDKVLNEWQELPSRDVDSVKELNIDLSSIEIKSSEERGRSVFSENALIGCVRCHSLEGVTPEGYINPVGPDLTGIGLRQDEETILNLIVNPSETSAMPRDYGDKLTEQELIDLVAFLSAQQQEPAFSAQELITPGGNTIVFSAVPGHPGVMMAVKELSWEIYDEFFLREEDEIEVDGISGPSHSVFPVTRGFGHKGMPAIGMTYAAAEKFCQWLSLRTSKKVRLPTVAEWEASFSKGLISSEGSWLKSNSGNEPHLLGSFPPNEHGFYDLIGNVAEWVIADPEAIKLTPKRFSDQGQVIGGSYMSLKNDLKESLIEKYQLSWQQRDPQWPKSSWWLSDGGFVGMRIVIEE
jgi:putative membrane-bound dehydrogenase-like protein